MKKIIPLLLIVLLLVSCGESETLKIGVVGSMSGNQSELSVSGRRGVELAVSIINDQGGLLGKEVELVVKDDLIDMNRAVDIVNEFLNEDIEIVIGPFTSNMMLAAYDTVETNEILYLSPTVCADSLNQKDDHFIRFIASSREQAVVLNEVALKNNDKEFIVIIDETNIGFNQQLYQNFKEILESNDGQINNVMEYSVLDAGFFKSLRDSTKDLDVDGVFIISNASDFATVAQNLVLNDFDASLYGTLWSHTNDIIRLGGKDIENAYLVSGISQNEVYPDFNRVFLDYYDRYGESMSFSAMYSYETMMALGEAISKGRSSDWEKVKSTLLEIRNFDGLQFQYELDKYGDSSRPYKIDQIINGGFLTVED